VYTANIYQRFEASNGFGILGTVRQSTIGNMPEDLTLEEVDRINKAITTSRELIYLSIEGKSKLGVRLYS
jgi:hypothetical protein